MIKTVALLALLPLCAFAQSANISRTDVTTAGLNLTAQNAVSPTYFANDGHTLLYISNASGGSLTAQIISQKTSVHKDGYGNVSLSDQSVIVPNGAKMLVGPFPTGRWNTSAGTVKVSPSTVSGVSMTAARVQ